MIQEILPPNGVLAQATRCRNCIRPGLPAGASSYTYRYTTIMAEPNIITQTTDYLVINKPAGFSVEQAPSAPSLYDWLDQNDGFKDIIHHLERGGVVHRLDVETSGVVIWAKTSDAQAQLKTLWQGRQVEKTYLALVVGECPKSGIIELPIERDNKNDRQKVALLPSSKARPAITNYQRLAVGEYGEKKLSLVEVHPITGRTHQIRVHLKATGHPIIGDKLYGEKATDELAASLKLERQFLHAWKIKLLNHEYEAPLPADLASALEKAAMSGW